MWLLIMLKFNHKMDCIFLILFLYVYIQIYETLISSNLFCDLALFSAFSNLVSNNLSSSIFLLGFGGNLLEL